jgi:hypothetical protein
LVLRFVADAPFRLVKMGTFQYLEPMLTPAKCVEVQDVDSQPGVDGGVWCPICEEWYDEEDCLPALDDAGNPYSAGPRAKPR